MIVWCCCYQRWRTNILCLGSSRKRINKPSQSLVLESQHPYIRVLVHNQNWEKKLECLQTLLAQLSLTFAMIMHILMSMKNGWNVYYSWPVSRLTHAETPCGSVHVSVFAELFKSVFIMLIYLIYHISLHGSKPESKQTWFLGLCFVWTQLISC